MLPRRPCPGLLRGPARGVHQVHNCFKMLNYQLRVSVSVISLQQSLYELLGVSPTADQAALKEAFFARSKEVHPDVNPEQPEAVEEFKRLAAAYEVSQGG